MAATSLVQWVINRPTLFCAKPPIVANAPFGSLSLGELAGYLEHNRLGFIYQDVCHKLFELSPYYQFLADEIQLFESQQTIGAIDFVVRNLNLEEFEHWEVAIKFYLLHKGQWYGPNAVDRLDKKLDHMLNHQLRMSLSDPFTRDYPEWQTITAKLLMQGRLHINPFTPEPVPSHCLDYELNPECIDGYWCFHSQRHLLEWPLLTLNKAQWPTGADESATFIDDFPADKVTYGQTQHGQFWFIVPDHWPNN